MAKFKVLLSKKHFVELTVEASDIDEARKKAFNDEYESALEDEEILPSTDYIVEDISLSDKGRTKIIKSK